MSDKKKLNIEAEEAEVTELNLDDLENVTGGSIKDVNYTETTDISKDTQEKI